VAGRTARLGVKEIEARITAHGARSRIRRLGFVDEAVLPALMRQSRAVTYPRVARDSDCRSSKRSPAGDRRDVRRYRHVRDAGDAALLASAGDALQLAEVLATALDMSDDERARWARRARERAEIFTWDSSVAQHVRAYEMAARR